MLDFLWNGGRQEKTSFLPKAPPPHPTQYAPPIQQNKATYDFFTISRNSPNTSCCLNPNAGSIADNIFNGRIFFPPPSIIYHDINGYPLPQNQIIQNRAFNPPSSITYPEIPACKNPIRFTDKSRISTAVAFC